MNTATAKTNLAGLLICLATISVAAADQEPTDAVPPEGTDLPVVHSAIDVTGEASDLPQASTRDAADRAIRPSSGDGAESLRTIPGVSLSRMGGHGLEPVVRGAGATSLNVLVDGTFIHGGCPNRMDPPTAYAADLDRVIVLRGLQTLLWGSGGSAGTVFFEREPAPTGTEASWSADATVAGTSWSESPSAALAFSGGAHDFGLNLSASRVDEGSYDDGNGNEVRSAYSTEGVRLDLAWTPSDVNRIEVGGEVNRTRDALFPGAGMDSPDSDAATVRFGLLHEPGADRIRQLRFEAALSTVDHLMDNYSLRPLIAPMAMRAPTEVDTLTLRLMGDIEPSADISLTAGFDLEEVDRSATRFAGPDVSTVIRSQSLLWPDVNTRRAGLVGEGTWRLKHGTRLHAGVRYDWFTADADTTDKQPEAGGPTPRQLWQQTYGVGEAGWDDQDWSALARLEHALGRGFTVFTGVSRSIRVPDASERFLASNSSMAMNRWIGNPSLPPEHHHQIDLGLTWTGQRVKVNVTGFADRVDDLVLRDRAHGQAGVLVADSRSIYRSVDARRAGIEADLTSRLSDRWILSGTASWIRATNRSDDRPIAQTPPLSASFSVAWSNSRWSLTATGRGAASQNRVDDDPMTGSGLDPGPTPSWAALDLAATMNLGAGFRLEGGIDNCFDRAYAEHLARSNTFEPDLVRVNEPGRTAWLRVGWSGDGP